MIDFEQSYGDPRVADSYVVLFRHGKHIGFIATKAAVVLPHDLRRLRLALDSCSLANELLSLEIVYRKTGKGANSGIIEISFAVKNGNEVSIQKFLEYARQSQILQNPIVSDMRDFTLK